MIRPTSRASRRTSLSGFRPIMNVPRLSVTPGPSRRTPTISGTLIADGPAGAGSAGTGEG